MIETLDVDLKNVIQNFDFKGKLIASNVNGSGHINDTYIVEFEHEGLKTKYVIQKINTDIFGDAQKLMENIVGVTTHIASKIEAEGGNPLRETLNVIRTKNEENHYVDEHGDCYRAFHFITDATTYQKVEEVRHMYMTGKALGKFQKQLNDFPADELNETIPDFHNTARRFEDFLHIVENDAKGRVKECTEEINYILSKKDDVSKLVNLLSEEKLPLRVTHNDTKFNNVMIDVHTGEAIAVIDLDTVMSGLSLYDFGDAIRSGATTALEDEKDLSKVNFDMELFEGFTKGYLEEMKELLTDEEINNLAFSAKLITLELAMRFLGDYLEGDIYFKTNRAKHNLDRARNQLKLLRDMDSQLNEMNDIIKKYAK
ncbi:MAG: phosphotransferase enzyme family protein [Sarcina sp.]